MKKLKYKTANRQTSTIKLSSKRRAIEFGAVLLTALGKPIFMNWLELRAPYVIASIMLWGLYIGIRIHQLPELKDYWGLTWNRSLETARIILPVLLFAIFGMVGIAFYLGRHALNWHIIILCVLYPIWGTIQHFLVLSLGQLNLQEWEQPKLHPAIIYLTISLLFALIHLPELPLAAATFFLALFYIYVFRRTRHLPLLGVAHGVLGGFFYMLVMNLDPWERIFGRL